MTRTVIRCVFRAFSESEGPVGTPERIFRAFLYVATAAALMVVMSLN